MNYLLSKKKMLKYILLQVVFNMEKEKIYSLAISKRLFFAEIPWSHLMILTLILVVIGILGDLAESMLKRGAKAKDAASIIPGHGGLLDRLDSLLFNAPLIYYYYLLFLKG